MKELKAKAQEAERKDEVLAAIYNCVLGRIEQGKEKGNSAEYFKKALSNPSLLARQKAANYTPLVKIGKDDNIFGGDLASRYRYRQGILTNLVTIMLSMEIERQLAMQLCLRLMKRKIKVSFSIL